MTEPNDRAVPLRAENLATIAERVPVPDYDRAALTPGIVHFGVGGFHRAHQAMFLDQLLAQGKSRSWGICGVGLLPGDARMRDALTRQDGLYTLVLKHPDGTHAARVIGSIVDYLFAPDDVERVLEILAAPTTGIVSLTITEGGYNIRSDDGEFDLSDPQVRSDLERDDSAYTTVFGLVVEGLRRRRERGVAPFTVMSCDNIQGNGDVARRMFTSFAAARNPELGSWLRDSVEFPNSMVDRITPVTSDADRELVRQEFGIVDEWPVVCEPFVQWVLEDRFALGRPDYDEVGVQLVDDVEPYELMKLRLLNASHQAMCYFGFLKGHRFAHEAASDPDIVELLTRYMDAEATPTLRPVPGIELDAYKRQLIERFANPEVKDTLARLCAESSDRIPKWLLPVVRHNLATGGEVKLSAAVVASWARYAEGTDESGEPIAVVDRLRDTLSPLAQAYPTQPLAFLGFRDVFGDLVDSDRFRVEYEKTLRALHERGAALALREVLRN